MRFHKLLMVPSLAAAFTLGACAAEEEPDVEVMEEPALEEPAVGAPTESEGIGSEGGIYNEGGMQEGGLEQDTQFNNQQGVGLDTAQTEGLNQGQQEGTGL